MFFYHVLPMNHIEHGHFPAIFDHKGDFGAHFLHHPQAAPTPECQEAPGVPSGYLT